MRWVKFVTAPTLMTTGSVSACISNLWIWASLLVFWVRRVQYCTVHWMTQLLSSLDMVNGFSDSFWVTFLSNSSSSSILKSHKKLTAKEYIALVLSHQCTEGAIWVAFHFCSLIYGADPPQFCVWSLWNS